MRDPEVICTCDTEAIHPTGQPSYTSTPAPIECAIPPKIIFYLLWIEDDLGLGHLHKIPTRNTHIMNEVYAKFLTKLYDKTAGRYEVEVRNIRKGHTPHNQYKLWKKFKLTKQSATLLSDNQSRAGAPYFFEAFDVLDDDFSTIDDPNVLVFTVTTQGRLKVRVNSRVSLSQYLKAKLRNSIQTYDNCNTKFTDSAMFALDKKWMKFEGVNVS